ncbi:MAG: TonB-dependent receptor, partial [Rikenellaceae bacterium]|nr:TonB-dependent receptor [Rikenellaceae bacterium]
MAAGADLQSVKEVRGGVTGSVKGSDGRGIDYATVVFTDKAGDYIAGATTGSDGLFSVEIAEGDYVMEVSFVGYKTLRRDVEVRGTVNMGDIVLEAELLEVDEVVVNGRTVIHRADGYSLALGDSKVAEGRNAREALKYVPGLWIDNNDEIKINGQGGIQVMINDRVVTMSSSELLRYLETINAEDVKSIDVVRSAGAKYDAAVGGAVLKITLRNRSVNGVFGNVSMSYERMDTMDLKYRPSVWVNVMHNKLSISTGFTYHRNKNMEHNDIESYMKLRGDTLVTEANFLYKSQNFNYDFRGVYQFDDRNSVGLDYSFGSYPSTGHMVSDGYMFGQTTERVYNGVRLDSPDNVYVNHGVSLNYRRKLDTLGSDLLVVADYHYGKNGSNNYTTMIEGSGGGSLMEYLRDESLSRNDFYTARIDVNKRFSKKWSLGYGAKYSYSKMTNVYDNHVSADNVNWSYRADYSDNYRYREGIGALYATASANLGRWSMMAGLRIENTDIRPKSLRQDESHHSNYTDFFPSASVSYAINPQKQYIVALNYRRGITRPGFGMLNASRLVVDNVTVSVGNPYLKPSYSENLTLNFTLAGKYMFMAYYSYRNNAFQRISLPDVNDPDVILLTYRNFDNESMFVLNTYLPFTPFKWWDISFSGTTGPMSADVLGVKRTRWF